MLPPFDAAEPVVDLLPALVAHTRGAPEDVIRVNLALDLEAMFVSMACPGRKGVM
jgi:hypothetical protein